MGHVGFIGLGVMGLPMAANLVRASFEVRAFVRTESRKDAVIDQGIALAGSVSEAVDGASVIITMVPDSPDVLALANEGGLLEAMDAGSIWVEMSTIDPEVARELHRRAAKRGIAFIDAPVSGGEGGAIAGSLSIMVGGDAASLETARPVLEAMGTTIVLVGGPGAGQVVKAANQIVVAGNIQVLAEALVFLRAHDTDLDKAMDVIGRGLAGSTVLESKRKAFIEDDFTPGFRAALHNKDLKIVQKAAVSRGMALPVTSLVSQFMQALVARGGGQLDHSALYALVAELNGTEGKR